MTPTEIIKRLKGDGVTLRFIMDHLNLTRAEAHMLCDYHGATRDKSGGLYRSPSLKRVEDAEMMRKNPEVRL